MDFLKTSSTEETLFHDVFQRKDYQNTRILTVKKWGKTNDYSIRREEIIIHEIDLHFLKDNWNPKHLVPGLQKILKV